MTLPAEGCNENYHCARRQIAAKLSNKNWEWFTALYRKPGQRKVVELALCQWPAAKAEGSPAAAHQQSKLVHHLLLGAASCKTHICLLCRMCCLRSATRMRFICSDVECSKCLLLYVLFAVAAGDEAVLAVAAAFRSMRRLKSVMNQRSYRT